MMGIGDGDTPTQPCHSLYNMTHSDMILGSTITRMLSLFLSITFPKTTLTVFLPSSPITTLMPSPGGGGGMGDSRSRDDRGGLGYRR